MNRTSIRPVRAGAVALTLIVAAAAMAPEARAQQAPADFGPRLGLAIGQAGFAIGAALGVEIFAPRLWFEIHAGETPPSYAPYPSNPPPAPPCCYAPPPPVMMAAPVPPPFEPDPVRLGLAVSGLFQSPGSGQSPIAGVAASLQVRTSPRSLFGVEVQSLASDRQTTRSRRDELAGLLAGRLFAWDAALAPYLELAGGLGHAAIDTQALEVSASQLIGRVGVGIELRLGPHLVLDTQLSQVHRLRLDDSSRMLAASDPAFIGQHEQSTEIRGGLGYRF